MRNLCSYPEPVGVENRVAEEPAAYESERLPNRLLNAREVANSSAATKRRFVAHTGADYSARNASASEEGGFNRKTSSTGLHAERQLESREREPKEHKHVKEDVWQSDDDVEARVGALGDAWSICGST
jgi:hypothetical protein